jgi:hypothetical protein
VQFPVAFHADLDAGDERDPGFLGVCFPFGQTRHGVMVGDGQGGDAPFFRHPHDFSRRMLAV